MSMFAATRYFLIGVLLVLNIASLVLATSVFSIAESNNLYQAIYVYIIFLSAFSCVFLIPIALIDYFRRGAIPSRILFELGWLVLFWILHLAAASALTAAPPCNASQSCKQAQHAMLIFSWLSVTVLLIHLAALLYIALMHMQSMPDFWNMGVRDYPWFKSPGKNGAELETQQRPTAGRRHPVSLQSQAPDQQQQQPPQQNRNRFSLEAWRGRPRSSGTRSWRDRYPSNQFSGQQQQLQEGVAPPLPDGASEYPFAGGMAGVGAGEGHAHGNEPRPMSGEIQQPLPVAFTLERTNTSGEQQQIQQRQRAPRPTLSSRPPANGETGLPFHIQDVPRSRVRRDRQGSRELPSIPPTAPQTAETSAAPARQSRGALPQPPPAAVQTRSQPQQPTESRQERSRPPRQRHSQQLPQPPQSSQPQAPLSRPPADSLLFSSNPQPPPQPQPRPQPQLQSQPQASSSRQPHPPVSQPVTQSQSRRSRERQQNRFQPPVPSFQPDTAAFYGTHIQSVLRPDASEQERTEEAYDGVSMEERRPTYASTPKVRQMSEAQAYAEAAKRKRILEEEERERERSRAGPSNISYSRR